MRITIDPSTAADPRMLVYYSADSSDAGLQLAVNESVPAEILSEPTFKWGFTASSGQKTDNKGKCTSARPRPLTLKLPATGQLEERSPAFGLRVPKSSAAVSSAGPGQPYPAA